jgi:hypothetical protein
MSWHPEDEGHQRALNEWGPTIEALRKDRAKLIEALRHSSVCMVRMCEQCKRSQELVARLEGK